MTTTTRGRPTTPEGRILWIKCLIITAGLSFAEIARRNNVHRTTPGQVLRRPSKLMEKAIADALGYEPSYLWPERYSQVHAKPVHRHDDRRKVRVPRAQGKIRSKKNASNNNRHNVGVVL